MTLALRGCPHSRPFIRGRSGQWREEGLVDGKAVCQVFLPPISDILPGNDLAISAKP